tara:strand:+ start:295 stop:534 length:240 start_codon:yes stop_codon:yes gene_type:complete
MVNDIIPAKPPLLPIGSLWKAWGLSKSWSSKIPFPILSESLFVIRKTKKLINEMIERRLNEADSVGITGFEFLYFLFLP